MTRVTPSGATHVAPEQAGKPHRPAAPAPGAGGVPDGELVGVQPWYPWPVSRWKWLTRPVRAERLAALRIALAALLLFDVLSSYLPNAANFYGEHSLGEPPLYKNLWNDEKARWNWSLLYGVQDHTYHYAGMIVWVVAISGLLVGFFTRPCSVAVWALSITFANLNDNVDNAGDIVRGIFLFYLMISPCGATWSVDAWLKKRSGPVYISPWPLRLILLQMVIIYWANGLHKVIGEDWQTGNSLYYVMGDATLSRWSKAQFSIPYPITRLLSWSVLVWEVTLPALLIGGVIVAKVMRHFGAGMERERWWRWPYYAGLTLPAIVLAFGVMFHLGIWVTMELGLFAPYMLCFYVPLLPWERLADRARRPAAHPASPATT
jgi:uncharacterized membrane protein YphA (DoxX/SURF4 family)